MSEGVILAQQLNINVPQPTNNTGHWKCVHSVLWQTPSCLSPCNLN